MLGVEWLLLRVPVASPVSFLYVRYTKGKGGIWGGEWRRWSVVESVDVSEGNVAGQGFQGRNCCGTSSTVKLWGELGAGGT